MSHENRKRQYKMFMERGQPELAEDQLKGHPELLKEIEEEEKPEEPEKETKSKKRK